MRQLIQKLIDEATRPGDPLHGQTDHALRLASETIRLARLAASTHMVLAARMTAETEAGETLAEQGRPA